MLLLTDVVDAAFDLSVCRSAGIDAREECVLVRSLMEQWLLLLLGVDVVAVAGVVAVLVTVHVLLVVDGCCCGTVGGDVSVCCCGSVWFLGVGCCLFVACADML